MTTSRDIARVLRYIGDIRGEKVSEPDAYEFLMDSRAQLTADQIFSESFRPVVATTLNITKRDQALGELPNFAFEIGIDYREEGQTDDEWRTLSVVAPERVADAAGRNENAASFYGIPRNVLLSFDPVGYEFQIKYVATSPVPADEVGGLTEEAKSFPEIFSAYSCVLAAHKLLPHAMHDDRMHERLERVIKEEIGIWAPKFKRAMEKSLKRESSRRPRMSDGYRRSRFTSRRPPYTE